MNQPAEKKPIKLSLDVEQWKRDIRTFSETTSQALNAIAAELSNECSTGHGTYSKTRGSDAGPETMGFPTASRVAGSSPTDDRLAILKSQLAERISKTN